MSTEDFVGRVLEMADILDKLEEKLESRAARTERDANDLLEDLKAWKRQLAAQEEKEIAEKEKADQTKLRRQTKVLSDVNTMSERLLSQLGQKFGKPGGKIVPRKMNVNMLRDMFQRVTDPSFLAVLKRLFNLDGYSAKKKMYEDFLLASGCYCLYLEGEIEKLEEEQAYQMSMLRESYKAKCQERESEVQRQEDTLWNACADEQKGWMKECRSSLIDGALAVYDKDFRREIRDFPVSDEKWMQFKEPEASAGRLFLGEILVPWLQRGEMQQLFQVELSEAAPNAGRGESIAAPYVESALGGMKLLVEYDENVYWLANFIQSLFFQILHSMPLYEYQMTFLDSVQNGRDLGDMLALSSIEDTETEHIHPGLEWDAYRILTICQDKEEIRSRVQELSDFMKRVSVLLGRTDSVEEFNKNRKQIIPYHFIVMENFPVGLDDETLDKLEGMIRQAKRFGFSFLLLGREGISAEFPQMLADFTGIRACEGTTKIQIGQWYLPFSVKTFPAEHVKYPYLDSLRRQFLASFDDLDNRFEHYIPYGQKLPVRDAAEKMMIPFAVNRRGEITELELGSSLTAHGLLSGGTGSGKTTLLHAIINSVMLHYRPEDVQLWLVDYKMAEFSFYGQNPPANIKLVGVQDNSEFTFAFLDYVTAEYERRMNLFKQATKEKGISISSMKEYRKYYGADSMPRILIIVDEFHKMTQQIQDNEYREILENHLSEVRASGITYLFSDQTVSVGLRGLTEKGRRQIMVRMAMKQAGGNNPEAEIIETIGIDRDRAKQLNESMDLGHVLFQQQVLVVGMDGRETAKTTLLHCKALHLDGEKKNEINRILLDIYGAQKEIVFADGSEARERSAEEIRKYLADMRPEEKAAGMALVLGTPSTMKRCMTVQLLRSYNQNILCIGDNTGLRVRILVHTIYSILDQELGKVCILAERNENLRRSAAWERIDRLRERGAEILMDPAAICERIDQMQRKIWERQSGRDISNENIFLFWIGMDNLFSFFQTLNQTEYIPKKKKEMQTSDPAGLADAFDSLFPGMREKASFDREEEAPDGNEGCYNACEDVGRLILNGPQNGIFNYVTYSAVTPLNMYRRIVNVDRFVHRIALKMDENSSSDLLNNKTKMASVDLRPEQAVYYDGGGAGKYFIPYR